MWAGFRLFAMEIGMYPEYQKAALALAEGQTNEVRVQNREDVPAGLVDALRASIPVRAGDFDKLVTIIVPPGGQILQHGHPYWVAIYYVNPCSPIDIEGELYWPEVGEILVIPPWQSHGVPPNRTDETRVVVAMTLTES